MLSPRNRQEKRRPLQQPLQLEALEDRTLLSTTPTTVLDLNGLGVNTGKYSSTDILVQFQGTPGTPGGPALVAGTSLGNELPLVSGLYEVNLPKTMTVAQALTAYKAEKGVLSAEPDYQLRVSTVPNDPLLSQQWNLKNSGQTGGTAGADIHAEQAWSVTTGSPNVVVAVMDTGINYNAPDLYQNIWINQADIPAFWYTKTSATSGYNKIVYKSEIKTATPGVITFRDLNNLVNKGLVWDNNGDGRIDAGDLLRWYTQGGWMSGSTRDGDTTHPNDLFGWNFVSNTNNPFDDNGHGTHVSGILGATGNNGAGIAGVDWNVQIMPVKFIDASGNGSVSNFIEGLNYAVQHGAKITNNSWEGAPYSQALYDAINNARLHGQIFVAAAGNEGANLDTSTDYPASFSQTLNNVVTVAATDSYDHLASFSNYGAHNVALAAPGVNILSTLSNGSYGLMSGTSMAAPEVTGAMALVWGLHPSWSYTQVINQVLSTTDKLSSLTGRVATGGRLDLAAAVGWNLSTRTTPTITGVSPQMPTSSSMNGIVLTFNESIDVSSFSSTAVTLVAPNGYYVPTSVHVVAGSSDRQVLLSFPTQTMLGTYHLYINSSVHDLMGNPMAAYQTTFTLQASQIYSNFTSQTITAGGSTVSSISIPANMSIGTLAVKLNATYPVDSNLYIYLIAPSGQTIALDYNRGGSGANFTNTVFTPLATTPIASGTAPFTGNFLPETPLTQLKGTNTAGTWRLAIRNYGTRTGTLVNWSLIITPEVTTSQVSTSPPSPPASSPPPSTPPATQTYSNGTAASIKAGGSAVSSITIPSGTKIGNLAVKVNVTYPVDSDLYIYLIAPSGRTFALDYNRGGSGANLTNTIFSQQAKTTIASGKAPFTGTFLPETSLSPLDGTSSAGTWRLAIRNYGSHTGTLVNWSLIVTPAGSTSSTTISSVTPATTTAPTSSSATSTTDKGTTTTTASSADADSSSFSSLWMDQLFSSFRTMTQVLASALVGNRS